MSALAGSCTNDSAGCLLNSDAHRRAREAWLASEHWLLDRYRELLALPFWSEPLPYDIRMPLPSFRPAMDGQKLLFVEALELAENGEAMRVNELLTADLRFWRRSLASSNYLISKMVALASIRRHFLYGNAVLRALPAGIASDAIPREWGVPARPEERSLVRCFGAEALFSINSTPWYLAQTPDTWLDIDGTLVKRVVVAAWPLLGPLVQPMDLGNRRAGRLHELARSLDVPYEGLRSAIERIGSASLRPEADRGIAMYNIAGIGLLERNVSYAGYADYGARTADFEGMRRATLLLATLRARSVPYGGRAGFVRGSELRDPYTNQPFEWIEASQTLVFEGLAQAQRGRFALAL